MKNYSHIISKLFDPLLITPSQHAIYCQMLEARLANQCGDFDARRNETPSQKARHGDDGYEEDGTRAVTSGDTAIIKVHGTLVMHPEDIAMSECGCDMQTLSGIIDEVESDSSISRVIYDFRTPGGTVTGIPETGRKILHSRKETIGFVDSICASGGAWLAAQCQRLYTTQSARFGSIGVYTMRLDLTEQLKQDGVKVNAIFAGKYKLLGAYWKPLEEDERKILQVGVDKIYKQFKEAMESHRMVSDENFGNGLVFDGEEAAALGFTDGTVESIDDILENMVGD